MLPSLVQLPDEDATWGCVPVKSNVSNIETMDCIGVKTPLIYPLEKQGGRHAFRGAI